MLFLIAAVACVNDNVISRSKDTAEGPSDGASEGGIENLAEEHAGFDCDRTFQTKDGIGYPPHREWVETGGIPLLSLETPLVNEIEPGEEATVRLRITAACEPIRVEGAYVDAIWGEWSGGWQEEAWANQTPAELRTLATGSVDGTEDHTLEFIDESMMWGWAYASYEGLMAEGYYEPVAALDLGAWDSAVYEFAFLDSASLPEGMEFNLAFHYLFWSVPGESDAHYAGSTAIEFMPDGGLAWTGEELSEPSDGNAPSVLYALN